MSTNTKRLNQLIDEQQALLNSIKAEAMSIDSEELSKENEFLKAELKKSNAAQEELIEENAGLKNSLSATKTALFAKMANEKLLVFTSTEKRLESIYYHKDYVLGSELDAYESTCIKNIDETITAIKAYGSKEFDNIIYQLNELKAQTKERRAKIEEERQLQMSKATRLNLEASRELRNEPLTEAEKRTAVRQKSLESFIGLNILGKAGILLFIIGIIMLGRYAYVHMSDVFKGSVIYLLGAVLIAIGEIFHKKENTIFSTTLISGGVATLYAAAATCYFAFDLYNEKITFILCIIITALAIALSNQVKSEVVCGFAAVGGYLPVVALYMIGFGSAAADKSFLPVSSVYFCLLAVVIFIMTYNKKWHIAQFIGYALHLVAIGGVAKCAYSLRLLSGYGYALPLAACFAIVSFIIYLLMPGAKIIKRKPILAGDSVLLGLNTLSGAISVSITIHNCIANAVVADRVVGFVFLAFTVIYGALMFYAVSEEKEHSTAAAIITSVSALIFSMLVVPLVFGFEYAGIGWAVEGAILATISINKQIKVSEYAGLLCMAFSVFAETFILYTLDVSKVIEIVSISIIISAFWIYTVRGLLEARDNGASPIIYILTEIITAFSTAGFIVYLFTQIMNGPAVSIYCYFTEYAVGILAFLAISVIIRLGLLRNDVSIIVSDIASIGLFLATFIASDLLYGYNEIFSYFGEVTASKGLMIANLVMLIVINIAVELFLAQGVLDIINRLYAPAWIYTMAISVSTLMLITATIMHQFGIDFSSIIISAVYIAVACVLLFIGFKKQYTVVRSGGLVLILCAFAKLCFVDTLGLDSNWKIASYFAFGAILIVISYFYQRFSKKLENDAVAIVENEEKDK